MGSLVKKATISHIVAFDFPLEINHDEIKEIFKRNLIYDSEAFTSLKPLNIDIYDEEFCNRSSKALTVKINLDFFKFLSNVNPHNDGILKKYQELISSNIIDENLNVIICFDLNGINSARFDIKLTSDEIKIHKLIDILNTTGSLIDKVLFVDLKEILNGLLPLSEDEVLILAVHDTYSIVVITEIEIDVYTFKREISGIIWSSRDYNLYSNETIEKITDKTLHFYEKSWISVGLIATLMIFQEIAKITPNPEKYIDERINLIEIYWRQKYLLKKQDYIFDEVIKKNKINLEFNMDKIKQTQINIQSQLDIYRNTRFSVTASFIIVIDMLTEVFNLDKHYSSVQEKLNVYDSIHQKLYAEEQNRLINNIQIIVVGLGLASLVLVFILDLPFSDEGSIKLILILLSIVIFLIFYKRIIKILVKLFLWIIKQTESI